MIDRENKTRVAVTLNNDLVKLLDDYACGLGVSKSAIVAFALRDYLGYKAAGGGGRPAENGGEAFAV